MEPLLVGVGGALGAIARYVVGQVVPSRLFPWGTLVVNALGSLVLAIVLFRMMNTELLLFVGVGFCGAFTTFSSFSYQTVRLWEQEHELLAVLNAAANLVVSLVAFGAGWVLFG